MGILVDQKGMTEIFFGEDKIKNLFLGKELIYGPDERIVDLSIPLCFVANNSTEACTVSFKMKQSADIAGSANLNTEYFPSVPSPNWLYSYDMNTWVSYTLGTNIPIGSTNPEKVYFKTATEYEDTIPWLMTYTETGQKINWTYYTCITAEISGSVAAGGNIQSLISLDYKNCTSVPKRCYHCMFDKCTSLTSAPALPATTLSEYCYAYMFYGCTSLKKASILSATTLAPYCCYYMFYQCSSLSVAPKLFATTLARYSYGFMFNQCTSLITAPELPVTTLYEYCYYNMFGGCTSLINAPALPATTLANSCYSNMFNGCTSLINAPALPATVLSAYCYTYMFQNCTSLTTIPKLPATTLTNSCYNSMFSGCTSLMAIPPLPATTLAVSCYAYMFYGLQANTTVSDTCIYPYRIPKLGTGTDAETSGLVSMFKNIDGTEAFTPTINTTFYVNVPVME